MKPKHLLLLTIILGSSFLLANACSLPGSPPSHTPTLNGHTHTPTHTHYPSKGPTKFPGTATPTSKEEITPTHVSKWTIENDHQSSEWQIYITGSAISSIEPENDTIWAASAGGLLHWDRNTQRLTQYLAPYVPLPSNHLSHLLHNDNKLYISGNGGLAIFDRRNQWTLYKDDDIGINIGYHAPMAMVDDVLWVAGKGGFAQLYPDGHWEVLRVDEKFLPTNNIDKITVQGNAVYVVVALGPSMGDERQVVRFSEQSWEIVDLPEMKYLETADGSLWKGEQGELLRSVDSGTSWDSIFEVERWIRPLASDDEGRVYASADDTIYVFEGDQIVETYQYTEYGPELNNINILEWGTQGRLWVATDGRGMTMFDGSRWFNWQAGEDGLREDCIRGLAVGQKKLYAGTHSSATTGGVSVFDFKTERWTNFWPDESSLSSGGVGGIVVDDKERVYFSTSVGILDLYDGENWEHISIPLPEGYGITANDGILDQQGNYWLATSGIGLWKYDGSEWVMYGIPGKISSLAIDQKGRLWVGGALGLLVRDIDSNWYLFTSDELPFEDLWVEDIAVDQQGRIWIVTINTLTAFNGQAFRSFSPKILGVAHWGNALTFDDSGHLWAEISSGVAHFTGTVELAPFYDLELPAAHVISENELIVKPDE